MEILVQYYGDTHHEDEHVHELRAFVHAAYPIAEIHSETEAQVGEGAEDKAYSHKYPGADPLHYETIQEAAESVYQRAYRYHYAEAGVGDAIFGGQAGHSDGKILSDEIIDGIDNHRHYDGTPLPILERFFRGHMLSSLFILSIWALALRMRVRTVFRGIPVSSAISPYCNPSTSLILAMRR